MNGDTNIKKARVNFCSKNGLKKKETPLHLNQQPKETDEAINSCKRFNHNISKDVQNESPSALTNF